jgi:ribosomal protein L37AE/L43A
MQKCTKCNSTKIKVVEFMGSKMYYCTECGYDERDEASIVPEERTSQKAKGEYTPYKTGGSRRTN